jgi:hypothetical protein
LDLPDLLIRASRLDLLDRSDRLDRSILPGPPTPPDRLSRLAPSGLLGLPDRLIRASRPAPSTLQVQSNLLGPWSLPDLLGRSVRSILQLLSTPPGLLRRLVPSIPSRLPDRLRPSVRAVPADHSPLRLCRRAQSPVRGGGW